MRLRILNIDPSFIIFDCCTITTVSCHPCRTRVTIQYIGSFSIVGSVSTAVFTECSSSCAFNGDIILSFRIKLVSFHIIQCCFHLIVSSLNIMCICLIFIYSNFCIYNSICKNFPCIFVIICSFQTFCLINKTLKSFFIDILIYTLNYKVIQNNLLVSTEVCFTSACSLKIRCITCRIDTKPGLS